MVKEHGVSINTVQKALNELARDGFVVAQGTRGTFVAGQLPHLARCGIVFPRLSDRDDHDLHKPYYAALLTEALRCRQRNDLELKIYEKVTGHIDDPQSRQLLEDVHRCRLAGLIVTSPMVFIDTAVAQLWKQDLPVVWTSDYTPSRNILSVHLANNRMIEQVMDHFVACGRRRVAVLGTGLWLRDVTLAALAARGLETRPSWLQSVHPMGREAARGVMRLLLEAREVPDALWIADDSLVEPATAGLRDGGARVPEDIEVVAHANFPHPTLSHVPSRRIGFDVRDVLAESMELIRRRRAGETVQRITEIAPVWEGELNPKPVRESASACKVEGGSEARLGAVL